LKENHNYLKEVYSIKNFQESYERVIPCLNGKEVRYNIPDKVFKRENLTRKNPKDLEKLLLDNYDFLSKEMRDNSFIRFLKIFNGINIFVPILNYHKGIE
jgi:hypothetical protein